MTKTKIKPLPLETLLLMLKKSVGTTLFQTLYMEVRGHKKDVTEKGNLSCAFYVSSVLAIFGLIDRLHSTVSGTEKALIEAGWRKTTVLKPGVILIWGKAKKSTHDHLHIGFYLNDNKAISNIWQKRVPQKHHFTFGKEGSDTFRSILAMYYHPSLK